MRHLWGTIPTIRDEASTDFAFASGIVVTGTHEPDWEPDWVSSARAVPTRARDEAVAAAAVIAMAAARRTRENNMGGLSRRNDLPTVQPTSAAHLRQYAVGGAL